jgi:spore coat protein JB
MAELSERNERDESSKKKEQSMRVDEAYRMELEELQKVDFALVELSLYLDTHPADMQALQQFNQLVQQRQQLANTFEMKYGPLLQFGRSYSRFPWQWVDSPWPWQV